MEQFKCVKAKSFMSIEVTIFVKSQISTEKRVRQLETEKLSSTFCESARAMIANLIAQWSELTTQINKILNTW